MAENKVCSHVALQIFIACLIPNLGAIIIFIVLGDRINEYDDRVESFLDPPKWVSNQTDLIIDDVTVKLIPRSFRWLGPICSLQWDSLVGEFGASAKKKQRFRF